MDDERVPCYHGTRRPYKRHGLLLGRDFHGGPPTGAPTMQGKEPLADSGQWVYFTTDLELAWAYAWAAPGRGRPRVLTIAPSGRIQHDPEYSWDTPAYRAECGNVLSVSLEPLITEAEAAAGWGPLTNAERLAKILAELADTDLTS